MSRISRPELFMEIARTVAKRATCMRLSVGAVLVHKRNIVSIGYNGVPSGHDHCQGSNCPGRFKCELTTHAERNAIAYLPDPVMTTWPLDLYVTDSPCAHCYTYIRRHTDIRRIFFSTPYRITDHLDVQPHESPMTHPSIYRLTPSGYLTNWRTGDLVDVET